MSPRLLAISTDQLRPIPHVIRIAVGIDKTKAVVGPPEPASSASWSPTRSPPGPSPPPRFADPACHVHRRPYLAPIRDPAGRPARRARRRQSWALLQGELVLGAWAELDGLVADQDLDGLGRPGPRPDQQVVLDEGDVDPVAAIVDAEADLLDLWRQGRVETEHLPPGPQAGQAAQHDVDRPGHRPQVDPLGGGATLHVGHVALQRVLQEPPGLLRLIT